MYGLLAALTLPCLWDACRAGHHGLGLSLVFAGVCALAPEACRRTGADARSWPTARQVCPEAVLRLIALTVLWLAPAVVRIEYETLWRTLPRSLPLLHNEW